MSPIPESASPSDARRPRPWSLPAKLLAYMILAALAAGSVYLIDRKVPALPAPATAPRH